MIKPTWVIGGGGHAKVVIEAIVAQGGAIAGVVDDNPNIIGSKVLGNSIKASSELPEFSNAIIAVGNNSSRAAIAARLGGKLSLRWQVVVHPNAVISPSAKIGAGTVVMAGAIIQSETIIGEHTIVNTNASIDHDGVIGDFCHVCPGVTIAGQVVLKDHVMIGTGASVIPCLTVNSKAIVGAGSCVIKDVPTNSLVVGVPAEERTTGR